MKSLLLILFSALAVSAKAQNSQQDSVHTIKEVVITARLTQREIVPAQSLEGAELQRLNSQSVADALRYFSGIQLKDYGGVESRPWTFVVWVRTIWEYSTTA